MPIIDAFLAEFNHESKTTRSLLERTPLGDPQWKPHPKSMSIAQLAAHLATIPRLGVAVCTQPGIRFDSRNFTPPMFSDTGALLDAFDTQTAAAREAMRSQTDETLAATWTLTVDDTPRLSLPRSAALRTLLFNHTVHHRGQLSVYLRLLDVPLPSIYGPSADTP